MDPVTVEPAVGSRVAASDSDRPVGLLKETTQLWDELHGLAHDHLQLAALETQRAGESLVTMITAGMIVAGLLLGAWLGLMGAAILALTGSGLMETDRALLLAVAVNLLAALVLCGVIRRRSHHLRFPANTGSLQPAAANSLKAEKP